MVVAFLSLFLLAGRPRLFPSACQGQGHSGLLSPDQWPQQPSALTPCLFTGAPRHAYRPGSGRVPPALETTFSYRQLPNYSKLLWLSLFFKLLPPQNMEMGPKRLAIPGTQKKWRHDLKHTGAGRNGATRQGSVQAPVAGGCNTPRSFHRALCFAHPPGYAPVSAPSLQKGKAATPLRPGTAWAQSPDDWPPVPFPVRSGAPRQYHAAPMVMEHSCAPEGCSTKSASTTQLRTITSGRYFVRASLATAHHTVLPARYTVFSPAARNTTQRPRPHTDHRSRCRASMPSCTKTGLAFGSTLISPLKKSSDKA